MEIFKKIENTKKIGNFQKKNENIQNMDMEKIGNFQKKKRKYQKYWYFRFFLKISNLLKFALLGRKTLRKSVLGRKF